MYDFSIFFFRNIFAARTCRHFIAGMQRGCRSRSEAAASGPAAAFAKRHLEDAEKGAWARCPRRPGSRQRRGDRGPEGPANVAQPHGRGGCAGGSLPAATSDGPRSLRRGTELPAASPRHVPRVTCFYLHSSFLVLPATVHPPVRLEPHRPLPFATWLLGRALSCASRRDTPGRQMAPCRADDPSPARVPSVLRVRDGAPLAHTRRRSENVRTREKEKQVRAPGLRRQEAPGGAAELRSRRRSGPGRGEALQAAHAARLLPPLGVLWAPEPAESTGDSPDDLPAFIGENEAAKGCQITQMGDNVFAAVLLLLERRRRRRRRRREPAGRKHNASLLPLEEELRTAAKALGYSLEQKSKGMKLRAKKVVAPTFHGAGIVVPVDKNDVGYRELPETDAALKRICQSIVDAGDDAERLKAFAPLQEMTTLVQFANDECDYGMGYELGVDLFCFGSHYLYKVVLQLLPLAYSLLKRSLFGEILEAHLSSRSRDTVDQLEQLCS
uniref:Histone PARylation factor 1 n=1 Tax=Scleropages formosus TaxID=113540 RepID=A0A8C9WRZ9_SCLFO